MVSMSRRRVKGASRHRRSIDRKQIYDKVKLGAVAASCMVIGFLLSVLLVGGYSVSSDDTASSSSSLASHLRSSAAETETDPNHPNLHVTSDNESESYNAVAWDIIQTLKCHALLNETMTAAAEYQRLQERGDEYNNNDGMDGMGGSSGEEQDDNEEENDGMSGQQRRRKSRSRRLAQLTRQEQALGEIEEDDDATDENNKNPFDDNAGNNNDQNDDFWRGSTITGQHLFCLAAFSANDREISPLKSKIHCDATHSRQQSLLDLWSAARAEILYVDILIQTLQVAQETERELVGNQLHLWAPSGDDGLEFVLAELNKNNADNGGVTGLVNSSLGTNKLFVDVGSCLGLTSMAVALTYPGTTIVSMEAASPNWLLQEMNWRCNDFTAPDQIKVLLAGVGANRKSSTPQMAKFMWRPHSTTSTRAWTPAKERQDSDVELTVKLRPWHTLLTEAEIAADRRIDVLNVDCEGCEYNLIPSLAEQDFDAISTVMGGVHWGYIPDHKKPSSERAKETHERLCRHENFARTAKECCAFPDLPVISSVPGEVLVQDGGKFPPVSVTVRDIAGELCDDFDKWAAENHLNDIKSDWGWFQITSMAD